MSTLWPRWTNETAKEIKVLSKSFMCLWLASALFPGDQYQDSRRSTQILETPFLLNRESFNMRIAERARDTILMRRLSIDMINQISYTLQVYYNGMASFLTNILDKDESEEWISYYYGALSLKNNLDDNVYLNPENPMVFGLSSTTLKGQIFVHPEYNWTKYYETCNPEYCEETKKMTVLEKVTKALGLVGGVITLVLGFVSVLLWPATGYLLRRCFDKSPASDEYTEQPQASLLMSTTVGSKNRLSHEPEV
ncbi:hypothetical protein M758_11G090900 [Ceratodon purpureus]|nr:hypothetical protein M758_11G090900 [Ceratodon purpureus]